MTGAYAESACLSRADLVVMVGVDTVEFIPGEWTYCAEVVFLSEWRTGSTYCGERLEIVGHLPSLLAELSSMKSEWNDESGALARSRVRDALTNVKATGSVGLAPHEVILRARAAAPADAIATVDAGAHMLVAMELWDTELPYGLLISSGLATMGYALPAAIAAALANPGRRVVVFVGDGGAGMVLAELETAARWGLPLTVVVFNDSRLSLIAEKATPEQARRPEALAFSPTNFAAIAEGFGVRAERVSCLSGFEAAFKASISASGPMVLDVAVDPSPYRHVLRTLRGQ
jgi:acetolactate synthase-1/2/3 large subunit